MLAALLLGAGTLRPGPAAAQTPAPTIPADLRNARYCEVLPVRLTVEGLKATVYNTLGYGDCPADKWDALTEADLRRYFDVLEIKRNGPRYFIMDRIIASGATRDGDVITIGGITFVKRAEISPSLSQAREPSYTEQTIDRDTIYEFDAGKPVFQLTAPDGSVYVMQTYAAFVDTSLTYDDLPKLGARLKLPTGWTYTMRVPDSVLVLKAAGKAIVIQDDLKNTYQKVTN
nr:hypothetical protein [Ancylobacter lacus]